MAFSTKSKTASVACVALFHAVEAHFEKGLEVNLSDVKEYLRFGEISYIEFQEYLAENAGEESQKQRVGFDSGEASTRSIDSGTSVFLNKLKSQIASGASLLYNSQPVAAVNTRSVIGKRAEEIAAITTEAFQTGAVHITLVPDICRLVVAACKSKSINKLNELFESILVKNFDSKTATRLNLDIPCTPQEDDYKGIQTPPNADKKVSPLIIAAWYGYSELVDVLLKAGADPNYRDSLNRVALILASFGNRVETVDILLDDERTNPNLFFINRGAWRLGSPLMMAIDNNYNAVVELLLKDSRIDVAPKDLPQNRTPLQYVIQRANCKKAQCNCFSCADSGKSGLFNNDAAIIELLLSHKDVKVDNSIMTLALDHKLPGHILNKINKFKLEVGWEDQVLDTVVRDTSIVSIARSKYDSLPSYFEARIPPSVRAQTGGSCFSEAVAAAVLTLLLPEDIDEKSFSVMLDGIMHFMRGRFGTDGGNSNLVLRALSDQLKEYQFQEMINVSRGQDASDVDAAFRFNKGQIVVQEPSAIGLGGFLKGSIVYKPNGYSTWPDFEAFTREFHKDQDVTFKFVGNLNDPEETYILHETFPGAPQDPKLVSKFKEFLGEHVVDDCEGPRTSNRPVIIGSVPGHSMIAKSVTFYNDDVVVEFQNSHGEKNKNPYYHFSDGQLQDLEALKFMPGQVDLLKNIVYNALKDMIWKEMHLWKNVARPGKFVKFSAAFAGEGVGKFYRNVGLVYGSEGVVKLPEMLPTDDKFIGHLKECLDMRVSVWFGSGVHCENLEKYRTPGSNSSLTLHPSFLFLPKLPPQYFIFPSPAQKQAPGLEDDVQKLAIAIGSLDFPQQNAKALTPKFFIAQQVFITSVPNEKGAARILFALDPGDLVQAPESMQFIGNSPHVEFLDVNDEGIASVIFVASDGQWGARKCDVLLLQRLPDQEKRFEADHKIKKWKAKFQRDSDDGKKHGQRLLEHVLDGGKKTLFFLEQNADPDVAMTMHQDLSNGRTALQVAVERNGKHDPAIVELLLLHKGNAQRPYPDGRTIFEVAKQQKNQKVIDLLYKHQHILLMEQIKSLTRLK